MSHKFDLWPHIHTCAYTPTFKFTNTQMNYTHTGRKYLSKINMMEYELRNIIKQLNNRCQEFNKPIKEIYRKLPNARHNVIMQTQRLNIR